MEVQANVTAGRLMAFASGKSGIFAADPRRRPFFQGTLAGWLSFCQNRTER